MRGCSVILASSYLCTRVLFSRVLSSGIIVSSWVACIISIVRSCSLRSIRPVLVLGCVLLRRVHFVVARKRIISSRGVIVG
jgi:hypothetical protein